MNKLFQICLLTFALIISAEDTFASLSNGFTAGKSPIRSGLWTPSHTGNGLDIYYIHGEVFVIWYTYTENSTPIWYSAQAPYSADSISAPLMRHQWDYNSNKIASSQIVGSIQLSFETDSQATFNWSLENKSGQWAIEPFVISGTPVLQDYSGILFNPLKSGFGISLQTQSEFNFSVIYIYDAAGNPTWLSGQNTLATQSGENPFDLYASKGACPSCEPTALELTLNGTMSFDYHNELSASFSFQSESNGLAPWNQTEQQFSLLSEPPSGRAHPSALALVTSEDALKRYIAISMNTIAIRSQEADIVFSAPPPSAVSQTNVQESGVDEADIIETDGNYLYTYIKSPNDNGEHQVRVLQMVSSPTRVTEVNVITFGIRESSIIEGLYLVKQDGETDRLVAVTTDGFSNWIGVSPFISLAPPMPNSFNWLDRKTHVYIFDVSNPASTILEATIDIDGGLVSSRRIESKVYVTTRYQADIKDINFNDRDAAIAQILSYPLNELIPQYSINQGSEQTLLDLNTTYLPPLPPENLNSSLITLSAFEINQPQNVPKTVTIMGNVATLYSSTQNLYIASSRWITDFSDLESAHFPEQYQTDIHQFALLEEGPTYQASGSIEGNLGYDLEKMPFRFSEYNSDLRILTSSKFWGELGEHRVTILRESDNADKLLNEVSHIPNIDKPRRIGKEGDKLFSLRFLNERLYVVTFKQIDPLYVIDLENPENPNILGELEIPGFSEYLHPLGNNLLLGFGKNAVISSGIADGRFAWYQGLQVALYDVTNPNNPIQINKLDLGERGSNSAVFQDAHALAFLPGDPQQQRPARFAIPMSLHGPENGILSTDPSVFYPWQQSGLYIFEVDEDPVNPQLRFSGSLISENYLDSSNNCADYSAAERSVIKNNELFFLYCDQIWTGDTDGLTTGGPF